jgi:methyl-accepting chemotaxis protein
MIIYFLLIGFASLLVGVEFVMDTNDPALREELLSNFQRHTADEIGRELVFAPIERLRNKAVLMILIIMFVAIIVLTMFIKNITEPLQHMIEVSQDISTGNLSRTIAIRAHNELAELGTVINDMASNLQEIILLSQKMCASGQDFVSRASSALNADPVDAQQTARVKEEIAHFKNELDMMEDVISCFNFYTLEDRARDDK